LDANATQKNLLLKIFILLIVVFMYLFNRKYALFAATKVHFLVSKFTHNASMASLAVVSLCGLLKHSSCPSAALWQKGKGTREGRERGAED